MRPHPRRTTPLRGLLAAGLVTALVATLTGLDRAAPTPASGGPASDAAELVAATNRVTPGSFRGYGFDQCLAPTQSKMDAWLEHSPFLAVGIYISGASRACRDQPNLTPTWISTQLRKGWRLLPITLGPQASCTTRERYLRQVRINPDPTNWYAKAKAQGRLEAERAVSVARSLGISAGSTLWYDLEAFDISQTHCRESAIRFVHQWTIRLHQLGYVSGFYSSAGSGIKMLDDARVNQPGVFTLPDYLWLARWDGVANTSTESRYLRSDGWQPHRRVKQYQGGHNETWGGVTINIDRNYLDVGRGWYAAPERHCGGIRIDYAKYETLVRGTIQKAKVQALQCLLTEQGYWNGGFTGTYGTALARSVGSWQAAHGFERTARWSRPHWVSLMSQGPETIIKYGSSGAAVRRLQRALNANGAGLTVSGVFGPATATALRRWQAKVDIPTSGVATSRTWLRLRRGR